MVLCRLDRVPYAPRSLPAKWRPNASAIVSHGRATSIQPAGRSGSSDVWLSASVRERAFGSHDIASPFAYQAGYKEWMQFFNCGAPKILSPYLGCRRMAERDGAHLTLHHDIAEVHGGWFPPSNLRRGYTDGYPHH